MSRFRRGRAPSPRRRRRRNGGYGRCGPDGGMGCLGCTFVSRLRRGCAPPPRWSRRRDGGHGRCGRSSGMRCPASMSAGRSGRGCAPPPRGRRRRHGGHGRHGLDCGMRCPTTMPAGWPGRGSPLHPRRRRTRRLDGMFAHGRRRRHHVPADRHGRRWHGHSGVRFLRGKQRRELRPTGCPPYDGRQSHLLPGTQRKLPVSGSQREFAKGHVDSRVPGRGNFHRIFPRRPGNTASAGGFHFDGGHSSRPHVQGTRIRGSHYLPVTFGFLDPFQEKRAPFPHMHLRSVGKTQDGRAGVTNLHHRANRYLVSGTNGLPCAAGNQHLGTAVGQNRRVSLLAGQHQCEDRNDEDDGYRRGSRKHPGKSEPRCDSLCQAGSNGGGFAFPAENRFRSRRGFCRRLDAEVALHQRQRLTQPRIVRATLWADRQMALHHLFDFRACLPCSRIHQPLERRVLLLHRPHPVFVITDCP